MAKFITLQCPECGAQLRMEEGSVYSCPFCGNLVKLEEEAPTIHATVHNHHYHGLPVKTPFQPARQPKTWKQVLAVWLVALVVGGFALFMLFFTTDFMDKGTTAQAQPLRDYRRMPESGPMQDFAAAALGKSFDSLTEEDLAQIQYLEIDTEGGLHPYPIFTYSLEYYDPLTGTGAEHLQTIMLESYEHDDIEKADVEAFTGLRALDGKYLNRNEDIILNHLEHLEVYFSYDFTPLDASQYYDPANIRALGVHVYDSTDLSALADFENLVGLRLNMVGDTRHDDLVQLAQYAPGLTHIWMNSNLTDYSWATGNTELTHLWVSGYNLTDYTFLHGLPKLESLEIDSASGLRDFSFVQSMPSLHTLSVEGSKALTLEPLRGRTGLHHLRLTYNSDITDYSALETLSGLKTLDINKDAALPSLAHLEFLTDVSLNSRQAYAIAGSPSVETLVLDGEVDIASLGELPALQSFTVKNDDEGNLAALAGFPSLRELHVSGGKLYGDTTLFNLPNLESLTLKNVNLPRSVYIGENNLKALHMEGCNFVEKADWASAPDNAGDLFASLPAIEELSVRGMGLDNIDFVRDMPNLRVLDIVDNYVNDVSPLAGHEGFSTLLCWENTIVSYELLPEGAAVLS